MSSDAMRIFDFFTNLSLYYSSPRVSQAFFSSKTLGGLLFFCFSLGLQLSSGLSGSFFP